MKLVVEFDWTELGVVRLEAGRLRFPEAPERPGIYRFTLTENGAQRVYIGEANQLGRRFQHYRTPGMGQPTDVRLNRAISAILADGGAVGVSVIIHVEIEVDGPRGPLDLEDEVARLFVQTAALTAAHRAGLTIENL